MKGSEFETMLEAARTRQDAILKTKGDDYTIDQAELDRLYNFKAIGVLLDIDPKKVLLVYLFKHIFSITAFVKSQKESEPITGRMDDAINYLYLLMGLIDEEKPSVEDEF